MVTNPYKGSGLVYRVILKTHRARTSMIVGSDEYFSPKVSYSLLPLNQGDQRAAPRPARGHAPKLHGHCRPGQARAGGDLAVAHAALRHLLPAFDRAGGQFVTSTSLAGGQFVTST